MYAPIRKVATLSPTAARSGTKSQTRAVPPERNARSIDIVDIGKRSPIYDRNALCRGTFSGEQVQASTNTRQALNISVISSTHTLKPKAR